MAAYDLCANAANGIYISIFNFKTNKKNHNKKQNKRIKRQKPKYSSKMNAKKVHSQRKMRKDRIVKKQRPH